MYNFEDLNILEIVNNIYNLNIHISIPVLLLSTATYKIIKTNQKVEKDYQKIKRCKVKTSAKNNLKIRTINEKRIKEMEKGEEIYCFVKKILQVLPEENIKLFSNNIPTLKIKYKNFKLPNIFFGTGVTGTYNLDTNTIKVSKNGNIKTFNHELLHAASTYGNHEQKSYFTGFAQHDKTNRIGDGINEGYTEILNKRICPENYNQKSYVYNQRVVSIVEMIVGKEEMQSLYFDADLPGLIEELNKYSTNTQTIQFIKNFDFYSKHYTVRLLSPSNKKKLFTTSLEINKYLASIYRAKKNQNQEKIETRITNFSNFNQQFYPLIMQHDLLLPKSSSKKSKQYQKVSSK